MKFIIALLLLCSTAAMAQPQVNIGEDSKGTYRLKKDSFVIYKEKDGEYIGLTTEMVLKGSTTPAGWANYKMLSKDCKGEVSFKVLRVNDYNSEVISTHQVKFNEQNIPSTMATLICGYNEDVKANPEINKDSIQNIEKMASHAPDKDWSAEMPLDENTIATLKNSIKFETIYVSMIMRLRYPAKTTDYYKLYIDKDFCKEQKGNFEMKTLAALEMQDIEFDLNKEPKEPKALIFHKIAKEMCAYTIKNNVFRKRIVIEDYNKPVESKGTMFDRK
jgi:hypothetical protein